MVTGGTALEIDRGLFIAPTVFDNVHPGHTIAREEIFGPVTAILTARSNEDAIRMANDTFRPRFLPTSFPEGISMQKLCGRAPFR